MNRAEANLVPGYLYECLTCGTKREVETLAEAQKACREHSAETTVTAGHATSYKAIYLKPGQVFSFSKPAALHKEGLGQELSDSIGLYALALESKNDEEIMIAIKRCVAAKRAWDAASPASPDAQLMGEKYEDYLKRVGRAAGEPHGEV